MLTEKQINRLMTLGSRADLYNHLLDNLVKWATDVVGDEDVAMNYIHGLWDLDRVIAETQEGVKDVTR